MNQEIEETIKTCDIHRARMLHASKSLDSDFPLTLSKYENWNENKIAFCDQLIYRFSKLQDSMGKLFRLTLEAMQEDTEKMTFKDILLRLEKLGLLEDHNMWIELRELRNTLSHEYPENQDEIIQGLNQLKSQLFVIENILNQTKEYIHSK